MGRALVLLVSILVLSGNPITRGSSSDDPNYRVFIERNPFALNRVSVPAFVEQIAPRHSEEIIPTVIKSIGGLRAYFVRKASQGAPPEYCSLGLDEKRNDLEVKGIDVRSKTVRVSLRGMDLLMTFEVNGVKPSDADPALGVGRGARDNQNAVPRGPLDQHNRARAENGR